jgi:hypothetical protein
MVQDHGNAGEPSAKLLEGDLLVPSTTTLAMTTATAENEAMDPIHDQVPQPINVSGLL